MTLHIHYFFIFRKSCAHTTKQQFYTSFENTHKKEKIADLNLVMLRGQTPPTHTHGLQIKLKKDEF